MGRPAPPILLALRKMPAGGRVMQVQEGVLGCKSAWEGGIAAGAACTAV